MRWKHNKGYLILTRNENFNYFHSANLNLDYAIKKGDDSKVFFEDGVVYTKEEAALLSKASPVTHKFKKIFNGIIVDNKKN